MSQTRTNPAAATLTAKLAALISLLAFTLSGFALWVSLGTGLPYISSEIELVGTAEEGQPFRFKMSFENHGKTPAMNFHPLLAKQTFVVTEPDKPVPRRVIDEDIFGEIIPGDKFQIVNSPPFENMDKALLDDLETGKRKIYIYGRANYRDVFYVSHTIRWCYESFRSTKVGIPLTLYSCHDINNLKLKP